MRKKGTIALLMAALCFAGNAQIPVADQFHLGVEELRTHLENAPSLADHSTPIQILLPTPDGTQLTFEAWEASLLSAELQAEYPQYRTYTLKGTIPAYTGKLLVSPAGLDGVIIHGDQVLFIEPVDPATNLHRIYHWKLGSDYLSFDVSQENEKADLPSSLRLAVLADEAYARFHGEDLARAVIASVNGLNAFLEIEQGLQLNLHYFETVQWRQILDCRTAGFRGRAGESLKLFGDLVAAGELELTDFDLGHLFSGRGFGSSTLAAVAGSDTYYDWNEDGLYDGPAKAGGGTGTVRPVGADWWGNLCNGISRQIESSQLALSIQRSTAAQAAAAEEPLPTTIGNPEAVPEAEPNITGSGNKGKVDFPHLSCLPSAYDRKLSTGFKANSMSENETGLDVQAGAGGAFLPWLLTGAEAGAVHNWFQYWQF